MKKQKINFFKRIGESIADFNYYKIIKKESLGKAFKYLILFSILIGLVVSITIAISFNTGIDILVDNFKTDIPYFEFDKGELNVEGDMPIIFNDGDSIVIIDTTNSTDEEILNNYERGVLIDKYKIINKKNSARKDIFEFSELKEFTFTKYDIQKYIPYLKYFSILIVFFILIWTILGKLLSTLIISVLGLIVNALLKSNLEYKDVYKIGIYSITLPSIIKLISGFVSFKVPGFFLMYYGIVIFYLVKAMTTIKDDNDIEGIIEK